MSSTLLFLVQEFCKRRALPVPATVATSLDPQVLQLRGTITDTVEDISLRGESQGFTREKVWNKIAGIDQGSITTLFDAGFQFILPGTFNDRTTRQAILGPMDEDAWQAMLTISVTGTPYRYRIRGDRLLFLPSDVSTVQLALEYSSTLCITDNTGVTYKAYFDADTDKVDLPDPLLLAGMKWRWRYQKGYEYAEEKSDYEMQLQLYFGRENDLGEVNLAGPDRHQGPGPLLFPTFTRIGQ